MKNLEERYLYSFTLSTINEPRIYTGSQNSKTEVGKLEYNFLLLKRKRFYCLLNRAVPLSQSQPRRNIWEGAKGLCCPCQRMAVPE